MRNKTTSWAEIDLEAIKYNLKNIKKSLAPKTHLMAIVKANAYGHGICQVALTALAAGADYLGVAKLEEALKIRAIGIKTPILVLGYVPTQNYREALENKIDINIFKWEDAKALSQVADATGLQAVVHLKIDTGMSRLGFQTEAESLAIIAMISELPGLFIKGIFTHFAVADQLDKNFTMKQFHQFTLFIDELEKKGIHIPLRHCANSAAIIDLPETHLDMVRAGIICYGLLPSLEVNRNKIPLKPAMVLKTRIDQIKTLDKGRTVSYGRKYCCERATKVATVPIGYADGYSRRLSNKNWAILRGQKIQGIGTICMDQCMFDISSVPDAEVGDEVILLGDNSSGITADDIAELLETINYEVICMIGSRIPRLYV